MLARRSDRELIARMAMLTLQIHSTRLRTPHAQRHDPWDGTGSRVLDVPVGRLPDNADERTEHLVLSPQYALEVYRRRLTAGADDLGSPDPGWMVGHSEPFGP